MAQRLSAKISSLENRTVPVGVLDINLYRDDLSTVGIKPVVSSTDIPFSVEGKVRRQGVGSILFKKLIAEARLKGYRSLRITTGAQNHAMRALAYKFGAHLIFRHGESTGTIDLKQQPQPHFAGFAIRTSTDAARAMLKFNRAWWQLYLAMYGLGSTAQRRT